MFFENLKIFVIPLLIFLFTIFFTFLIPNPDHLPYLDIYTQCYNDYFKKWYIDRLFFCSFTNIFFFLGVDFIYVKFIYTFLFSFIIFFINEIKILKSFNFFILFPLIVFFNILFSWIIMINGFSIFCLFIAYKYFSHKLILRLVLLAISLFNHYSSILFIFSKELFNIKYLKLILFILLTVLIILIISDKYITKYISYIKLDGELNLYRLIAFNFISIFFLGLITLKRTEYLDKQNVFIYNDLYLFLIFLCTILYFNFNFFFSNNSLGQLFVRSLHIFFALNLFNLLINIKEFINYKSFNIFLSFGIISSYLNMFFFINALII